MKLLAFAASHRRESVNRRLAQCAAKKAREAGAEVDFAEYGDFDAPLYDDELFNPAEIPPAIARCAQRLLAVDGVILSSPEYNHSFPGSLKNLLDWLSVLKPAPLQGKTALLLSASPSLRGGMLGLAQLRTPLAALGVLVHPRVFSLSRAGDALAGESLADAKLDAELGQLVGDFTRMTAALV